MTCTGTISDIVPTIALLGFGWIAGIICATLWRMCIFNIKESPRIRYLSWPRRKR